MLIVATDRISAFDSILPTGIPHKGAVLTNLTLFWLDFLKGAVENHLITADVDRMGPKVRPYADILRGRAMLVKKADVFPIECVVRGYLAGSGWKSYRDSGAVCGVRLPKGLRESEKLPEPIFTPATKAASGHDENISFEQSARIIGRETAEKLRQGTLEVYRKASDYARARGIIICDTKFEWGRGGRAHPAGGRGPHAGLVALLARRRLPARPRAAELRQAIRARLAPQRPAGTRNRPRRRCPKRSSARRAKNISRRTRS